ncbi:malonate decarboxylase subunit alpha, partial [Burkholderia contaminans]|uniref:malonate decarboxylase subunit alpha n=1 Tax=Burkholderia contaminans TaxID=488447 RepID=UPI0037037EFA
ACAVFGGGRKLACSAGGGRLRRQRGLMAGGYADPDTPAALRRGRKLVVQIGETFGDKNVPMFVEKLDALKLADKLQLDLAPIMVYGDDVTHIVTEEGIANLLMCRDKDEREHAIRGVAGYTEIGRGRDRKMVERLRERGVIRRPEDLGIDPLDADRRWLAARSIKDLVHWSGGLYAPPARFRNW